MNIEKTKKAITVMQAYVDGDEIEVAPRVDKGAKAPAPNPSWNWGLGIFYVKPKPPKERWAVYYRAAYIASHPSLEGAQTYVDENDHRGEVEYEIIKLVEDDEN